MPKPSDLHASFLAYLEGSQSLDDLLTLAIIRSKQIARRSLNAEDADEAAIDTALALNNMLPMLDPKMDILAMLTSITNNKIQDVKRKAKPNVSLDEIIIEEPRQRETGARDYQYTLRIAQQAGITGDMIKRMTQGFSVTEIAAQDDIPIETLRTRFKRLKKTLAVNQISIV